MRASSSPWVTRRGAIPPGRDVPDPGREAAPGPGEEALAPPVENGEFR